jgi:glycine betaine catabolism A
MPTFWSSNIARPVSSRLRGSLLTNPHAPIDPSALDRVVADFGRSLTLPAAAYIDPNVLEWELENVFRGGWVCVGRSDDLLSANQIRAVQVGGEGVLLARDGEGSLSAFSNVCRHRGHELAPVGAPIDVRSIRCPYHSWSYRFDGSLRAAPTITQGPDFDMADYPLIPVAASDYLGWVWVDLSSTAGPIAEHFGNLAELSAPYQTSNLTTVATHSYVVEANWKIVVENYNECYHCSTIHPELCEVTPPESGLDHQPTGMWLGGTMDLKPHAVTMSLDGDSKGVNFEGVVAAGLERQVWYLTVVPNLLLSMHPDYVMTHQLTPLSAGQTMVECSWLFSKESIEAPEFDPSYASDFWDITNREDWSACEGVMRGVANRGYRPGPLSSWEGTVYQFLGVIARYYLGEGPVVPVVADRDLPAKAGP